jgi:glycine hydroxymethyltransferase
LNKNTVPGDKSPFFPSAIRIGSPAMTTRGLEEKDFDVIFSYLDRAAVLGLATKKKVKGKKLS